MYRAKNAKKEDEHTTPSEPTEQVAEEPEPVKETHHVVEAEVKEFPKVAAAPVKEATKAKEVPKAEPKETA